MPDQDGYPTDEELQRIRDWPLHFEGLVEFVAQLWRYPCGVKRRGRVVVLHTFGWSGNEEVIGALQQHPVFWCFCWQKSFRGGHYWFALPRPKGDHDAPARRP